MMIADVIAGQGTVALEIVEQAQRVLRPQQSMRCSRRAAEAG